MNVTTEEPDPIEELRRVELEVEDLKRQEREFSILEPLQQIMKEYARQLSTIIRQLVLGAVAFAWLFRYPQPDNNGWVIPSGIAYAMLLFLVSIALDILHYLHGTIDLHRLFERWQRTRKLDWTYVETFRRGGAVTLVLFYSKVGFALIGLAMLFICVLRMTTVR